VSQLGETLAGYRAQYFRQATHLGAGKAIENVPSIPTVLDKPGLAQDHEVLRDVALPQAQGRLHVTHALLAVTQNAQDCYARRMAQCTKQVRLVPVDLGDSSRMRHYIQFLEYDYRWRSRRRSVPNITHRH
jgi:hypothetical protein